MTTGKVHVTSDATIVTSETFKLGQVGTESQEMGERLKKHEDETKECFSIAKGKLTDTKGDRTGKR